VFIFEGVHDHLLPRRLRTKRDRKREGGQGGGGLKSDKETVEVEGGVDVGTFNLVSECMRSRYKYFYLSE
jgi:hypothetical protein